MAAISPDRQRQTPDTDRAGQAPRVVAGSRPRPPKLYRAGEVVEYSGLSRQTIHNYTAIGLIRESGWTPGGHRLYDDTVFERIDRIAELKALGRQIAQIRDQFAPLDSAAETVAGTDTPHADASDADDRD